MRRIKTIDNKGAALVMVILAMMFVGIIAAIALTLTVGNSKSTKATIDTSENREETTSNQTNTGITGLLGKTQNDTSVNRTIPANSIPSNRDPRIDR